jgi:hypothetical protein
MVAVTPFWSCRYPIAAGWSLARSVLHPSPAGTPFKKKRGKPEFNGVKLSQNLHHFRVVFPPSRGDRGAFAKP